MIIYLDEGLSPPLPLSRGLSSGDWGRDKSHRLALRRDDSAAKLFAEDSEVAWLCLSCWLFSSEAIFLFCSLTASSVRPKPCVLPHREETGHHPPV